MLRQGDLSLIFKKWLYGPLLLITAINMIWAYSLELYADEAYYFLYGQRLAFGYFDHPPAVGLLSWIGPQLIGGELGVRLIFVLLTSCCYGLLYSLVKPENKVFFWLVVFGLFPIQLVGFLALPDVPLLFFVLLFFLCYKRFLAHQGIVNILLLSVSVAGMLYSKYHGALVIFFTVISNPQLFRSRGFYLVVMLSLFLFAPHLWWLYQNDFVTISYHLFERESRGFGLSRIIEYVLGFCFFNGPFLFILLFIKSFNGRVTDFYERAMFVNLIGFFLFFLFMSFRGSVEANWTLPALVPAVVLGFKKINQNKFHLQLAYSGVVFIIVFRMLLLFPVGEGNRLYEFHGHKEFAEQVKVASEGLPIVANRYQEASLLTFYLNEWVPALNIDSRRNQFDLWGDSEKYGGETVMFLQRSEEGDLAHPYFGRYQLEKVTLDQSSSKTSRISITSP